MNSIDTDYVIVGAGAIGSIIAAHLTRAGHRVAVLARGSRARQLQKDGLRIEGLTELSIPVTVSENPRELAHARTLIIATKTPGTEDTLRTLGHLDVNTVFSIQNGVQKNDLLAATFGRERTLGSLADTSGEMRADGSVLFTRNVNLMIGELAGGMSARSQQIARDLDAVAPVAAAAGALVPSGTGQVSHRSP